MKTVSSIIAALVVGLLVAEAGKNEPRQLDVEARKFFKLFTRALEQQEASEAVKHVAPKYREGFIKGYRFWRGTKLSALKIIGPPDKEGVLRVKTEVILSSGRKDTETKKLLWIKDRWFLFEK